MRLEIQKTSYEFRKGYREAMRTILEVAKSKNQTKKNIIWIIENALHLNEKLEEIKE